MSRSLLCTTALLIGAIVAFAALATMTIAPKILASNGSPVVATHESSGLDVRPDQPTSRVNAVPNSSHDGPGAVSPDPYRPAPAASCLVSYQTTAGDKTVLKYGTIEGCSTESSPTQSTGSGTNA